MIIKDSKTIQEIQQQFNQKFPYLKIEFYQKAHAINEGSPNSIKWENDKLIGEIRTSHNSGNLSIRQDQKVGELEEDFLKDYGLNVQVFYQSGDIWLQTTSTDTWTLKEQNDRAELFKNFQESKS